MWYQAKSNLQCKDCIPKLWWHHSFESLPTEQSIIFSGCKQVKVTNHDPDNECQISSLVLHYSHQPGQAQVWSDCQVPHKKCSGMRLLLRWLLGVSILEIAHIAAFIGQSDPKPNYWLHCHYMNACVPLRWADKLRSVQCFVAEYFPQFWGNWSNFPCKV